MESNSIPKIPLLQADSRIAMLGYGVEGRAMTSYLFSHGFVNITVCDRNEKMANDILKGFFFHGGPEYLDGLDGFDVIFRSPGISPNCPEFARFRAVDRDGGRDGGRGNAAGKLTSLMGYFFEHCPCPIIGVTGTKGKGTTSTLIYEILCAAGCDVYLGGNIGEPPVVFLDFLKPSSLVVLELSSFQLIDLNISPHVAVVLNITSEHMDYHRDVSEYVAAKQNIARYQGEEDFLILNRAHSYSADDFSGEEFVARRIFIDTRCHDSQDKGFIDSDGMLVVGADGESGDGGGDGDVDGGGAEKICHVSEIGLLGHHNLENVLSAIVAARIFDVPFDVIRNVVKSFRGLPHRLEFVGEVKVGGDAGVVRFYNDSFSTTPETSIAGMLAFTPCISPDNERRDEPPLYLLAGGSEKKSIFDQWAATVSVLPNLRLVFLMGPSGERMGASLREMFRDLSSDSSNDLSGVSSGDSSKALQVSNLREAFEKAFVSAREDILRGAREVIVLLSPGAASFNEFENYKKRGEAFWNLVQNLKGS